MRRSSTIGCAILTLFTVGHVSAAGPSADQAFAWLQEGNARFANGAPKNPNTDPARLQATFTNGQRPFATILACSDSRVPVERLFDRGFGDLFVVRVAGNVCDNDEAGSIEYAVGHLETPLLVVLGHRECGAVNAVVTGAEVHGCIPQLVDNIEPAAKRAQSAHPNLTGKALVPDAIEENVWQSIEDLCAASPSTRERVKVGKLRIEGAIYDLESGAVRWIGAHPQMAKLVALTSESAPPRVARPAAKPPMAHAAPVARPGLPTPAAAFEKLQAGNAQFVAGKSPPARVDAERLRETFTNGQKPFATVLSCADSRLPTERIFNVGVGDTFVVRVAGNVADTDEIGSIEYGCDHLGTPLLVVLGHRGCGAVAAVVNHVELHGCLPGLLDNIEPTIARLRKEHPDLAGEPLMAEAVRANVRQSIDDLLTRSHALHARVDAGLLKVVGGVYDIETGRIEWLDSPTHAAEPSTPTRASHE